jgi:hypothetical protein
MPRFGDYHPPITELSRESNKEKKNQISFILNILQMSIDRHGKVGTAVALFKGDD